MGGRIFITLFALPFFGVGVWMLWSVSSTLFDAWDMRGWQPTEARLLSAGYNTHSGDDSNTYGTIKKGRCARTRPHLADAWDIHLSIRE